VPRFLAFMLQRRFTAQTELTELLVGTSNCGRAVINPSIITSELWKNEPAAVVQVIARRFAPINGSLPTRNAAYWAGASSSFPGPLGIAPLNLLAYAVADKRGPAPRLYESGTPITEVQREEASLIDKTLR
jgi:hypothetical protein